METNKQRNISDTFFNDLKNGCLKGFVDIVKCDDTLCLEFRGTNVVIYYRGGSLYTIEEKTSGNYFIYFNDNYKTDEEFDENSESRHELSISEAIDDVCKYKYIMDIYFSKHKKYEREFQQLILRENNYAGKVTDATDYYILDIEYAYNKGDINARFDMLAVKWPSEGSKRKKQTNMPLVFIEVKYGDGAVSGAAGIVKHIDDYIAFRKNSMALQEIAEDMAKVFNKKHSLGLITSYDDRELAITIDSTKPEFLFAFANHDPASKKIKQELEKSIDKYIDTDLDILDEIKVIKSSEMGYGLFAYKDKEFCYPCIREYVKE